ncbi:MAG: ABC transporter substrate-binding protein [Ruminococcus sp.]
MSIKKLIYLSAVAMLAVCTGCNEAIEVWKPIGSGNTIQIAVVGDDEFYTDGGTVEAMELASSDFYNQTGIEVKVRYYDDDADYHKAIAYANEIALDNDIAAVIIKEEIDFVDTVADIYEAAQKPFIITNGCYNHTIEKDYKYLLVDFINAKSAGSIMGQYVIDNRFQRAVFCHSDTEYEEDELKGFQSKIEDSSVVLTDIVVGPYTQEEFDIAYSRWQALGVDVICVSNYYSLNSDLVRMLRQKGSDIQVVSDYVMDTDYDIERNGKYLDGTVIVPLYLTGESADSAEVKSRFCETYGFEMLERAVQSYDLIYMLSTALNSGISDSSSLMEALKSEEGYEGLHGTVTYDSGGALIPSGDDILTYSDGGFRSKSKGV